MSALLLFTGVGSYVVGDPTETKQNKYGCKPEPVVGCVPTGCQCWGEGRGSCWAGGGWQSGWCSRLMPHAVIVVYGKRLQAAGESAWRLRCILLCAPEMKPSLVWLMVFFLFLFLREFVVRLFSEIGKLKAGSSDPCAGSSCAEHFIML